MSGRPPTPPKDEEMDDVARPAAAGPIGAGAGAAAVDPNYGAKLKATVIRVIKSITNIQKDLQKFYDEDDPNSMNNIRNTIQQNLTALENDNDFKEYARRQYKHFEGVSGNGQLGKDKFYDEVEFALRVTKDKLTNLAEDLGIPKQELEGGKRRKTRKNKKSKKHKKTSRRHK